MHLSVIIPAFNEEKNLFKNVLLYNDYLLKQDFDFEIIIVNDGSKDDTLAISEKLKEKIKNFKIINFSKNQGKGAAIRAGLLKSSGKFGLFIDADNAVSIEHLEKVWPHFIAGADLVIGSRSPRDAKGTRQLIPQATWKIVFGKTGNFILQFLTAHGIKDTQCGFKIFKRDFIQNIIPKTKINRWTIDAEILALAQKFNYTIKIIPVDWKELKKKSNVGLIGYFIALKEVIIIKYNLLNGKYD